MEKARWPVLLGDGLKGHNAAARPRSEHVGNLALVKHLLDLVEDRSLTTFAEKHDDVKMELVFKAEKLFHKGNTKKFLKLIVLPHYI